MSSERFFLAFLSNANRRAAHPGIIDRLSPLAPVAKYWTGRPAPTYLFQEPIAHLEVVRVTSLQIGGHPHLARRPVLALRAGPGQDPSVVTP